MEKENKLQRNLDWKQGLSIALGVPLLILPSLGYFTSYVYSAAILVWVLSTLQGFFQNIAYAEMAIAFPNASGLPGYAQTIFKDSGVKGRFLGGFSAWSYWLAWNPVMAIFSLIIGGYLVELVPFFSGFSPFYVSLGTGIIVFSFMLIVNLKGTENSAVIGYVLNIVSLLPLIGISIVPFIQGNVDMTNITLNWFPSEWVWDLEHFVIIFGIFGMAQWSACAWETAAIYGPEYKNPSKDTLKALFSCGTICLLIFVLVQTSAIASLGIEAVGNGKVPPLLLMAKNEFGSIGASVSVVMLIVAMITIIRTGFLGSSRAMHSMAVEGNLPIIFRKTNSYGVPVNAMVFIIVFNCFLIMLKTPAAILAASSMGYSFANGISLVSYYKYKNNTRTIVDDGKFRAPEFWKYIGLFFGMVNLLLFVGGLVYLNSIDLGWKASMIGIFVLLLYIPLFAYSYRENNKEKGFEDEKAS
jgi:amino acid transporter